MKNFNTIFVVNQVVKKSKYDVPKIAEEAGLTEGQLRIYMNSRPTPLEQYAKLIKVFTKLEEPELAAQLLSHITDSEWCFYFIGKNEEKEIYPLRIFQELTVLLGNISKIFENVDSLDAFEKMHASIDIQKTISKLHDLLRIIDSQNRFLRLWD